MRSVQKVFGDRIAKQEYLVYSILVLPTSQYDPFVSVHLFFVQNISGVIILEWHCSLISSEVVV